MGKHIVTYHGNRCSPRNTNEHMCNNNGFPKAENKVLDLLLSDLDSVYGPVYGGNIATNTCIGHYYQNWSYEKYIDMVQINDDYGPYVSNSNTGGGKGSVFDTPVDDRIWFAGEFKGSSNAAQSGMEVGKAVAGRV